MVRVEVEALIAGVAAAVLSFAFALIAFHGETEPIWADWDGWSIGKSSVIAVGVLGMASAVTGYWRSRRLPGHEWRLELPSWKFTLDAVVVAVVHTSLAALATAVLVYVAQLAFRTLSIDPVDASVMTGVVSGFAAYVLYLAVARLTTVSLSQRMFLFVGVGILASMATSTDPVWWRYHISHLGALGDRPSISFNAILVIAGAIVTTFALYVDRDIRNLRAAGVLRYGWAPPFISALFIAMGIALAGIGFVPVNVSVLVHNTFSIGLTGVFGLLMLSSPVALRGMPWQFFAATLGFLLALAGCGWLYLGIGYMPLTTFELIAFGILFCWISMLVRFLAALLDTGVETTESAAGRTAAPAPAAAAARTASAVRPAPATEAADADDRAVTDGDAGDAESAAVPPRPPLPSDTGLRR